MSRCTSSSASKSSTTYNRCHLYINIGHANAGDLGASLGFYELHKLLPAIGF